MSIVLRRGPRSVVSEFYVELMENPKLELKGFLAGYYPSQTLLGSLVTLGVSAKCDLF